METKSFNFKYTTPLYGSITSPFGYREHPIDGDTKFHYGIDIGAAMGSDIVSFADGVVDAVGVSEIYGKYIKILHSDGVLTFYGHCGKTLYKPGQKVKMGTVIARVGSTGVSTGPHLHFEVRLGDSILDPTPYINPEKE